MNTRTKKSPLSKRPAAVVAPARSRPRFWWYAAGAFVFLYAGLQVYSPVLHGPFVFDDSYLPFRVPNFPTALGAWVAGNRPLLMFSYWINFVLSGADTLWYHIFNVLFHVASSVLVFFIVRKVLSFPGAAPRADERRRLTLAIFTGALFLLHPLQTESVAYVASRSENLSVLFFFAAFTLFLYRRSPAVSWRASLGVLALFAAAVTVKEHTVALVALLLLTDSFWNPGFSFAGIRRNWRLYVPVAAGGVLGGIWVWRVLARATTAGFHVKDFTWYQYFFTQCRAFFLYLRLFFFPVGQNADYDFPVSHTLLEHGAIFGLVALVALIGAAVYWRRRYPLASYGFLVFVLLLAPTSSFIPIQDPVAERRLYLAMIGLLFVVADLLARAPLRQKTLAVALGSVLLVEGALTYQRSAVWSSDIALWQDTAAKSPRKPRPHFQLAYAYQYGAGRCDLAVAEYENVARLQPATYDLLIDWGEAYDCNNQPDQALAKLRQAAAMEPSAHAYTEIGMVCGRHARYGEALEALNTAEKIDPNYAPAFVNRGGVYLATNQPILAVADYRRAVALDPNNAQAVAGLAQAERALRSR